MQQNTETAAHTRGRHQASQEIAGWTNIEKPGFYVGRKNGQGYRVTAEVLVAGASPALSILGAEDERFVLISPDPYLPVTAAKILCADNDISPKF